MRNVTAIICIGIVGSSCYILGCNGDEVKKQGDIQRYENETTDLLLHRSKRSVFTVLLRGASDLARAGNVGFSLVQSITGGCATFPSICSDKTEIEKLDKEIKGLRKIYAQKFLATKKAYLSLKNANTDNAYIMYYINESIQAVQSLKEYQEKISEALEIELNEQYKQFEANSNSTEYLSSTIGELECSLSYIRDMIDSTRKKQIISLACSFLVEFAVNRFANAYSRAYNQIATKKSSSFITKTYKKLKYVPKVLKKMGANVKGRIKKFGTSLKNFKNTRNWQGFKNNLKVTLKGPTRKVSLVKKFVTSSSNRKYAVKNHKLGWSQGLMTGIGIIFGALQTAIQTHQWKKVADDVKKAREKHEEYLYNLKEELANINAQTAEIADLWPEIIETFKDLSLPFKSLIDNATKYSDFYDVLGLPKLPSDITSSLFSLNFNAVTKASLSSAQAAVIEFMKAVNNNMTWVVDRMQARSILYENVQKMAADKESVQKILLAAQRIYKFSSSLTIQNYGKDLSKKDIVCTVSQISKTKTIYDFYQLEPFRPICDVNATTFTRYDDEAGRQRRDQLLTSTVSHYNGSSLSTLLDLVNAAYHSSADVNLQNYGKAITDQQVMCSVSKVFPSKLTFDYISLDQFHPDCLSVTAADFQNMKNAAVTIRAAAGAVEAALITCTKYQFCPCPALIAQENKISELKVIDLIRTLKPNQSQYCGTTGCSCVDLKS